MVDAPSLSQESLGYKLTVSVTEFKETAPPAESPEQASTAEATVEYSGTTQIDDTEALTQNLVEQTNAAAESSSVLRTVSVIDPATIVKGTTGCELNLTFS